MTAVVVRLPLDVRHDFEGVGPSKSMAPTLLVG